MTDPPPDGWIGYCATASLGDRTCWYCDGQWLIADGLRQETVAIHGVVRWLDVTDEPAVSRAAVQAAVDEIERKIRVNSYGETDDNGICYSVANDIIEEHTGVTPTLVRWPVRGITQ